jgi:hypothetical protein
MADGCYKIVCEDGETHSTKIYDPDGECLGRVSKLLLLIDAQEKFVEAKMIQVEGVTFVPTRPVAVDVAVLEDQLEITKERVEE